MFGHGVEPDLALPDFAVVLAGGVAGVELLDDVAGAADVLGAGAVVVVEDAAALDMPAAAPPAASAPATMVAPSIFEIVIGIEPPGVD